MKKGIFLVCLIVFFGLLFFLFKKAIIYTHPAVAEPIAHNKLTQIDSTTFILGNNWLRKNEFGNWECYVEGSPYERGLALGLLQKLLIAQQEAAFVLEIEATVPNSFYRKLLTYGISWFNRNLDEEIPLEYRKEIYGVSQYFSDDYDFIGPKYNRIINYHAAHDIGHMAQNMNLVACTAVAKWKFDDTTQQMLVGRNFDFYFGDEFAKNKIILLMKPDQGYAFVSVTWGGFCGVVSGMNETGLTVTLNALPSEMPTSSATPVSIIARDVLQYASTIQEAYDIVAKYPVFVSESFTITSKKDKMAAVIEKTPTQTDIFYPEGTTLIVTNHFQGSKHKDSELNKTHLAESESAYRFNRVEHLISNNDSISPNFFLRILRDRKGAENQELGNGNPMAINQMIAHHGVIFNPIAKIAYISSAPYQEGVFTAYNLNNIKNAYSSWRVDSLQLQSDPFLQTSENAQLKSYRKMREKIVSFNQYFPDSTLSETWIGDFVSSNPHYYEAYKTIGDYYYERKNKAEATVYYARALERPIPYNATKVEIEKKMNEK